MNKSQDPHILKNLKRGTTFRFENKTWKVTEIYRIKWNDGTKSVEYKVKSNSFTSRYLEVSYGNGNATRYSFWRKEPNKEKVLAETQNLENSFISVKKAKFSKKIVHYNTTYNFKEKVSGICKNETVNAIEYSDISNTKFLAIEIWDDEVEVSSGFTIQKTDISYIIVFDKEKDQNRFFNTIAVLIGILFLGTIITFKECSPKNKSWDRRNNYSNDSSKVHRNSNSYYRGRSSRGYGK